MLVVRNLPVNAGDTRDEVSIPGSGRSHQGGNGNSFLYFLPGRFHEQRSMVSYSPWDGKRVRYHLAAEHKHAHAHTHTYIVLTLIRCSFSGERSVVKGRPLLLKPWPNSRMY